MFDEKKINALLGGSSPQKKTASSAKKKSTIPKKITARSGNQKKSESSTSLDLHEITWGEDHKETVSVETPKKSSSPNRERKKALQHQEYLHEKRLSEDRLIRLRKAEARIEHLEKELRIQRTTYEQEMATQSEHIDQVAREEYESVKQSVHNQQEHNRTLDIQLVELKEKYDRQVDLCEELQKKLEEMGSSTDKATVRSLVHLFQEHGIESDEYKLVFSWLVESGIFPLSYLYTHHEELLQQVLRDKCHIQASNIPLPKENSDLYIEVPLARCPLSGGEDIIEQSRLFKDECLINGYTKIVIFGVQGKYESLFQMLFAHHALQMTLSPAYREMEPRQANMQIEDNQLAFSWGEDVSSEQVFFSNKDTIGEFLKELVSHLRSTL